MIDIDREVSAIRADASEVKDWYKKKNFDLVRANLRHIVETANLLITKVTNEEYPIKGGP